MHLRGPGILNSSKNLRTLGWEFFGNHCSLDPNKSNISGQVMKDSTYHPTASVITMLYRCVPVHESQIGRGDQVLSRGQFDCYSLHQTNCGSFLQPKTKAYLRCPLDQL
ncbi:hypothetical protein PanWU01x14_221640 [Parasponia andersonii]|uniref:Uncharacterized protein n=1 Tax=Parasponia andersonii TaxID=3476 RepID=A0A2P5BPA1_PARAD|nr:hypothetical protein PanWU01x14_221640 [Parasponia andersonii]